VERSMTAMMKELGLEVRGGVHGTINGFKEQITRFAACKFEFITIHSLCYTVSPMKGGTHNGWLTVH
jgi:hypothetical protein